MHLSASGGLKPNAPLVKTSEPKTIGPAYTYMLWLFGPSAGGIGFWLSGAFGSWAPRLWAQVQSVGSWSVVLGPSSSGAKGFRLLGFECRGQRPSAFQRAGN